jgi:hypothetical protein
MRKAKLIFGLLGIGFVLLAGCASDPENLSERPWNSPKSWENGLPTQMMNQR